MEIRSGYSRTHRSVRDGEASHAEGTQWFWDETATTETWVHMFYLAVHTPKGPTWVCGAPPSGSTHTGAHPARISMLLPCPRGRPAIPPFTALLQPGQRLLPLGGGALRASLSSSQHEHAGAASRDPGGLSAADWACPLELFLWRWKNLRKALPRLQRFLLLEGEVQDAAHPHCPSSRGSGR